MCRHIWTHRLATKSGLTWTDFWLDRGQRLTSLPPNCERQANLRPPPQLYCCGGWANPWESRSKNNTPLRCLKFSHPSDCSCFVVLSSAQSLLDFRKLRHFRNRDTLSVATQWKATDSLRLRPLDGFVYLVQQCKEFLTNVECRKIYSRYPSLIQQ